MRARLTSSHFVGRVGELAELELALAEAAARRPVVVLLGGDSGVGKSRLVGEFEQRIARRPLAAEDEPPLVLRGEAVEQGEGELPYAPLLGALRPLVRERHPAFAELGRASRAQLAALLPGLEEPDAEVDQQQPSAQLRVFEALLELLDLLSDCRSLILVLEDMHWADRSTRMFISFLSRSLRRERMMALLTYRTDELHRRHALRPLLAELERLERARRVHLEPFDRAELAEALSDIIGDVPSEQLVDRLFARSEGNPLYTEELLAAGLDGRGATPQSLRDAFLLRIERLSEDAQRAARVIAVGRALDEQIIGELSGIGHDALHLALREAVSEQILVAGDDGRLSFRHALLREALYDDLLPGERGELHLALARALEDRCATGDDQQKELSATVATHYAAGGDQPAALRAAVRAALAARQILAYADAADLAERALELWPRVPDTATMLPIDHVELLSLCAAAHVVAGDHGRAEVLLLSALEELDPDHDPRRYSRLLAPLARVQWALNRGIEGVNTAQRALAMLPGTQPSRERASLQAWLARTRFLRGRFREAASEGEQALAAAIAAGDSRAEGEVLNTLGMAKIALGEVDEGAGLLRRALELARENDDVDGVGYAYSNLAAMLGIAGRTLEALAIAKEGLEAIPARVTRSHDWMALTVADLAFEAGDWRTARAHLERVPSQLVGVHLIFRQLREAEFSLGFGDEDAAERCLEQVEPLVESSSEPQWIGPLGSLLGELRRRRGDLEGARAAVAHALDRLEVCTDDVMQIARVTAVGAHVEADIAQRARDLREKAQGREAIARLRLHQGRLRAAAQEGGPVERAWHRTGIAELARARGRSDPGPWLAAAAEWDEINRPYHAAIARWRAAEARVENGDRAGAAGLAQEALAVARRLGSRWLEEEVTGLGERARLALASPTDGAERSAAGDQAPEPARDEDPFGLTPRERQVLALIAEGATNRQIGAALYMAEKTASVHVSRILSKLGVRSRTQAAAMAHRLHLA